MHAHATHARLLILGAALLLAGAAAGQGTASDPLADTFGAAMTQLDIVRMTALTDGISLFFTIEFSGSISPSDSGAVDAAVGYIEMDSDQDSATGGPSSVVSLCPLPGMLGPDFTVDLFSYASATGQADVVDSSSFAVVGSAAVSFAGSSLSAVVPLAAIGDEGIVDAAAIMGTPVEPTDCVPDGGVLTSAFAAPSLPAAALPVLIAALLAAGGLSLQRRRRAA